MHAAPGLASDALSAIQALLNQGFLVPHKQSGLLDKLIGMLQKSFQGAPQPVANILVKIQYPDPAVIELALRTQSACLFQNTSTKLKSHILTLLSQLFGFYRKVNSVFTFKLYRFMTSSYKHIPQQFTLMTAQQHKQLLQYYIKKSVNQIVDKVEFEVEQGKQVQGTPGAIQRGKFGICFMCRKPADYYCKDTKVSVCGVQCKRNHLLQASTLESSATLFKSRYSEQQRSRVIQCLTTLANLPPDSSTRPQKVLALFYLCQILLNSDYIMQSCIRLSEQEHGNALKLSLLFLYLWHMRRKQLVDHLFSEMYIHAPQEETRVLLTHYWLQLFTDQQLFKVFENFDLTPLRPSVVKNVLQVTYKRDKQLAFEMTQRIVSNVFSREANSNISQDPKYAFLEENRLLVDAINSNKRGWDEVRSHFQKHSTNRQDIPNQLALFLRKYERCISRDRLGEIFADSKPQTIEVLECFIKSLHLETLQVDEGLREIFFHFSVGESQQIFRVIEAYIKLYSSPRFEGNSLFEFAYFIMMLQTELHNTAIEKPMTFENMQQRVASFNSELAKDTDYLFKIYSNIKRQPFSHNHRKVLYEMQESISQVGPTNSNKALLIFDNWSLFYTILSSPQQNIDNTSQLIYRVCLLLIEHQSAQMFLHLLLKQMQNIDFLTTSLPESRVFLISSVFNLIWHQPDYVDHHWKTIFSVLKQYYLLNQRIKETQNPMLPMLVANKDALKLCLTQAHIGRLYHTSSKLRPDQLSQFCKNLISPESLLYVSNIVTLNYQRCAQQMWPHIRNFIAREHRYISKLHIFSPLIVFFNEEALKLQRTKQQSEKPGDPKPLSYLQDIISNLRWTAPVEEDAFIETILCIISNEESTSRTCHYLHPYLWELILDSFHSLSKANKAEICEYLKTHQNEFRQSGNTSKTDHYAQYVVQQVQLTGNECLGFMIQHNIQLITKRPDLFEGLLDRLPKEVLKYFISPKYLQYIVRNLSLFPSNPELFQLLRTNASSLTAHQVSDLNSFLKSFSKSPDAECIHLLVALLQHQHALPSQIVQTLTHFLDGCKIVFPNHKMELNGLGTGQCKISSKDLVKFGINYPMLVKKSVAQLTIVNSLSNIHRNLSKDRLKLILPLIEEAVQGSRGFNRNTCLRYLMWKDGLLRDLKQLPGLLKKQRVSQSLKLSVYSILASEDPTAFLNQSIGFLEDLCTYQVTLLSNGQFYRKMCQNMSDASDDLSYYYLNEIQRQVMDYKKTVEKLIEDLNSFVQQSSQTIDKQNKVKLIECLSKILACGLSRDYRQESFSVNQCDMKTQALICTLLRNL